MNMQILLVEDDELIAKGLTYSFKQNGYNLVHKTNIKDTSNFLQNEKIEFIILDISLPDGNGLDLYNNIIKKLNIPTIFLTAKDDEETIVKGLELGAEDYITKPYSLKELAARVYAQVRRSTIKRVAVDRENQLLRIDDRIIPLAQKEFELFLFLLGNPGRILSASELYQEVWRTGKPDNANTVAVHMTRLRHKLEEAEPVIGRIETVLGEGYRFLPKVEAGTIL